MYGLPSEHWKAICRIFYAQKTRLRWVKLFGSRARRGRRGRLLTLNLYLDATIQRFEFCFELAWKLMKAVLSYEGIEVSSPRASIREGWKQGLVQEAEAWLDMLEKRNLSAHTYNEQTAQVIYAAVKGKYFAMLAALDEEVAARWEELI